MASSRSRAPRSCPSTGSSARAWGRRAIRTVVADPKARYFGAELQERSLLPTNAAHLGGMRFNDWLAQHAGA